MEFGGYLKNIYEHFRTPVFGQSVWEDLSRVRLTALGSYGIWRADIEYDNELYAGSYLKTPEFKAAGIARPLEYFNWDGTIAQGSSTLWRDRVHRGWVGAETGDWTIRAGRQRIAWGTGKIWNPTDILNPYQPLTIERDERFGADAVYARRALGQLSQAELAYGPQDRLDESGFMGRLRGRLFNGDASVMGGKVGGLQDSWIAGGDGAWDLGGGTWHVEGAWTQLQTIGRFARVDTGYEYTFSDAAPPGLRGAWVLAEYFHNGQGVSDPRLYNVLDLLDGRAIALARDYLGFGWSKDLHPLVKLEIYAIANLTDGSWFAGPAFTWNAQKDLHLTAGTQAFWGGALTEYGRLSTILHAQAQYYF